ncbi:G-protein coupled receptor moody-like [Mytilus galloprovincialis]|uniref:G-protein coupled receptor moody-like n=1 Tax=Mytilus galloprovincialis TaxID=29158 RepID=UPI003F7BDFEE
MKDKCMEWWCDEPETLLVLEIIVIVLSLIGCVWNIITILAICFSSLRFKTYCVFIGSLSLAGFLYCCVILPLEAVTFHKQYHSVPPLFCNAVGGVRYTLVGVIVIHLGIIALYRYLNVVHLKQYQTLSKRKPLIITIAIGWLLPLVFTMPASLQVWGGFKYVPAILACTFDRDIEQSNRVLTVTLGFIVPCIFIIFCYVRIGIKAYGSSKRAKSTSLVTALRRSAMMLCIFAAYFVGTFPYFVVNIYDQSFSKPVHHVWTTFLGWTLYCVNPIVYTVMDFKFRRAYKQFFSCKCEKNPRRGSSFTRKNPLERVSSGTFTPPLKRMSSITNTNPEKHVHPDTLSTIPVKSLHSASGANSYSVRGATSNTNTNSVRRVPPDLATYV